MKLIFIVCFSAHILHALLTHARSEELPRTRGALWIGTAIQMPLFLFACAVAYPEGVFSRDLVFPPAVFAGLVLGHIVFGFSLLAVHRVPGDAWALFLDLPALAGFLKECPNLITKIFVLSFTEELIYRVAAQTLLIHATGSALPGIVLLAVVFALTHRHFYRNGRGEAIEFLAFSLLLGALYHVSGSLILVTLIHAMRNLEIAHVDLVARQHEHGGDDAEAWRDFEEKYGFQGP